MFRLILSCLFILSAAASSSQLQCSHNTDKIHNCGLEPIAENMFTFVAPPESFEYGGDRDVTISVTYNGFTMAAQNAFQYAVDIWASTLTSDVPILVDATWEDIPGLTLGYAGANGYYASFPGAAANTYYPSALADKMAGFDLDPGVYDIVASFDSGTNWYFGTDGNTPGNQYDFVTVVLHELGHGLGVIGSADYDAGIGYMGFSGTPVIYDYKVENGSGTDLVTYTDGTSALGSQLVSDELYWNGAAAVSNNSGINPKMYAPGTWSGGSSYAHIDELTYPFGTVNSLMTPQLGQAEAIHNPGPIIEGLMEDIGWTLAEGAGCTENVANLSLTTDCWGEETSWTLEDEFGNVLYSAALGTLGDQITYNTEFCLLNGCYTFYINDEFGDGLDGIPSGCGSNGTYQITDSSGNVLVSMGAADFGFGTSHSFCVGDGGGCLPVAIDFAQGFCQDDGNGNLLPVIELTFTIDGTCNVEDLCFFADGTETCFNMPNEGFDLFDGDQINLINTIPDIIYEFWFTTADGISESFFWQNGNCSDAGCTNPFATNYDPAATAEDGSCVYDATICDCDGTVHTIGVLVWIGDGFADDGSFEWDGQPVNFNCDTWGYDCGDIEGAPSDDPWGVCFGDLPPNNGCGTETLGCTDPDALNYNPLATVDDGSCIYGDCFLEENFDSYAVGSYIGVVSSQITTWSGVEGGVEDTQVSNVQSFSGNNSMYILQTDFVNGGPTDIYVPVGENTGVWNASFEMYMDNGFGGYYNIQEDVVPAIGWAYEFYFNGDGTWEIIVDAVVIESGTYAQNTWLHVDNEFDLDANVANIYVEDVLAATVSFTTSFGGINFFAFSNVGTASFYVDDLSVCPDLGEIPGCTDSLAVNYNPNATVDDGSCVYNIPGCTSFNACNYNPEATINDGSCFFMGDSCDDGNPNTVDDVINENCNCMGTMIIPGCTDLVACNYNPDANMDDASCYYPGDSCDDGNPDTINDMIQINCNCEGSIPGEGCTDATACNYDPDAEINNGTCIYPGAPCNDGNPETINDVIQLDCSCSGTIPGQGCTSMTACNYDPDAEVDNGSCFFPGDICNDADPTTENDVIQDDCECAGDLIVVMGCTDSEALNYNPAANTDDGSCIYECDYPILNYEPYCESNNPDVFFVAVTVSSLGNGAPYLISNNQNDDEFEVAFTGTINIGPFDNGVNVVVAVNSIALSPCFLTSPLLTMDCMDIAVGEWSESGFEVYPNPNFGSFNLVTGFEGTATLQIYDVTGKLVYVESWTARYNDSHQINVGVNLNTGMYMLRVQSNGVTHQKRMIIE